MLTHPQNLAVPARALVGIPADERPGAWSPDAMRCENLQEGLEFAFNEKRL